MLRLCSLVFLVFLIFLFNSCDLGVDPAPPSDPVEGSIEVVDADPAEGSTYLPGDTISIQVSYDIPNFDSNRYNYGLDMVIQFDSSFMYFIGYADIIYSSDIVSIEGIYFGKSPYMEGDPVYPYEIYIILYRYGDDFEFISMTSPVIYN